jgi:uncharacterized protein
MKGIALAATKAPAQRVLVTGASGFVGQHLCAALAEAGVAVLALQHRHAVSGLAPSAQVITDLGALPDDLALDAIVNLAGARILGVPWTASRRNLLLNSRLGTTTALVQLVARLRSPPPVMVSASAVGYYGVRGDEPLDEAAASQPIFQSQLCERWERAAMLAQDHRVRVVMPRLGVVLGTDGGALPSLLRPARIGLGAILGEGRQGFPWIHIDDVVALLRFAIDNPALRGPVNAVAPGHVTQAQFQRTLGNVLGRGTWVRVPAWPLRLMLGEMAQLLVDGQHVVPSKAAAHGFRFQYPELDSALVALLTPGRKDL